MQLFFQLLKMYIRFSHNIEFIQLQEEEKKEEVKEDKRMNGVEWNFLCRFVYKITTRCDAIKY